MNLKKISVKPKYVRFLDLKAIDHLIGDLRNGHIGSLRVSLLYFQLEAFLKNSFRNYSPEVGSIPSRLLDHNKLHRNLAVAEMANIDADVLFSYDATTKRTHIEWKAYFEHSECARPKEQQRVVLHIKVTETTGLTRVVSAPLQVLMVGYGNTADGYQGYAHSIVFLDDQGKFLNEVYYIGVTGRNWLIRMEEHLAEIRGGSNRRFHSAWRAYAGDSTVMLSSELIVLNHTFDGIMAWEEEQVDAMMNVGKSLNMIPGGFKGLRFLHEHRLTDKVNITLGERDIAIAEYVRNMGIRPSVPNLFLAELWRDDAFYLKVLAGRSDVLTPKQVLDIRDLTGKGLTPREIFEKVGGRNIEQIKRVIDGKTYTRIYGL